MRTVFFSSGGFGAPALRRLAESKHSIVAVVTSPDKPSGRGLKIRPSHVKQAALEKGLPVFETADVLSESFRAELGSKKPDIFFVVSFGVIFPRDFLAIPPLGSLNLHASLLPRYRGASPIAAALANGDTETGVTMIQMNERLDAGDILLQERVAIGPDEDEAGLASRLAEAGAGLAVKTLDLLGEGRVQGRRQDEAQASYAPKLKKSDGLIDWTLGARAIHNRVRAFALWPVARTLYKGKELAILKSACPGPKAESGSPCGAVLGVTGEGIAVQTGDGILCVQELRLAGSKTMGYREFVNGHPVRKGDMFEMPDERGKTR